MKIDSGFGSHKMRKKTLDWLVVLTILKNMKVNGTDDIPYIMEKNV